MTSPRDLVVHESGDPQAPPLVLVHGLTEAGTTWPDAVRRWSGRWRLLAVDLRGHGRSPRFADGELSRTSDIWLADLRELVAALPRPPVLVGHSLGAYLALRLASADPGLVRALVLEDPPLPAVDEPEDPSFAAHNEAFLDGFVTDAEGQKALMRRQSTWSPEEIDAWAECKPLVDRRMIRRLHLAGDDWEAVLDRLEVPTLLLVPESDDPPPAVANPLLQVRRIPGVGHSIRRDDPTAFHAVVDPFLAGLDRA